MKRVLVISDSHGFRGKLDTLLMKAESTGAFDAVVHLGDGYRDMDKYLNAFPLVYQVPGNCDGDVMGTSFHPCLFNTNIYMTHGHGVFVKSGLGRLAQAARNADAPLALFGHTHVPCMEEVDGVTCVNPGSAMSGYFAVITLDEQGGFTVKLYEGGKM